MDSNETMLNTTMSISPVPADNNFTTSATSVLPLRSTSNFSPTVTTLATVSYNTSTTSSSTTTTNSLNTSSTTTLPSLEEINDARAMTLVPAMVFLGILMVLGILGNCLVCFIFLRRLRRGTQNFLIVCLAVLDLLSCTIAIPTEIADIRYYFMFGSEAACRIMRFITTFCSIGSSFALLVIAIDRYRKICQPFKRQIHIRHAKLSLIPIVGGALLFSWPAFIMNGLRTTETEIPGLYGHDCSTPDAMEDTIFPLLYNVVMFAGFLVIGATLVAMYVNILRETKRHNIYMSRNSDVNIPPANCYSPTDSSSFETTPTVSCVYSAKSKGAMQKGKKRREINSLSSLDSVFDSNAETMSKSNEFRRRSSGGLSFQVCSTNSSIATVQEDNNNLSFNGYDAPGSADLNYQASGASYVDSLQFQSIDTSSLAFHPCAADVFRFQDVDIDTSSITHPSMPEGNGSVAYPTHEGQSTILESSTASTDRHITIKRQKRIRSKTTLIAFMVTSVFIISFLPNLTLQVVKVVNAGFDQDMGDAALVFYNMFLRFYFVNSASNPVIYGVLNAKFRCQVRLLAKELLKR